MRKLMIAAAAAALTAGAFAAEPQVYEMTLTVKSTQCATGKKTVKVCDDIEFTSYRKQVTRKYEGLFWGCGCEVIACPTYYFKGIDFDHDTVAPNEETDYIFWSATKGFQYGLYGDDDAFQWQILQLVGPKAANIEGTWTLVLKNTDDEIVLDVAGAGYGTATDVCNDGGKKIKSMSGYVVGSVDYAAEAEVSGCQYCGELTECTPFQFCECIDVQDKTALFGSWSLKYNSSAAKKLAQGKYIESAYKFPKYLNLGNYTADDGTGTTEQTTAQKAEAAYKAAVEALAAAEAGVKDDATIAKEIQAQEDALNTAKTEADTAKTAADTAFTTADTALKAGTLSDYATAGADLVAAKEAVVTAQGALDKANADLETAKTQAEVKTAKTAIENAQTDLDNAQKALSNVQAVIAKSTDTAENKAAFAKLESDYDTAKATQTAAAEAATEAADAVTEWTKTGKKEAQDAAKKASDEAKQAVADAKANLIATKAACIAAGGTCE